MNQFNPGGVHASMPDPGPLPRPAWMRQRGPDEGSVNITRSRTTKPGWHIRVGPIHIRNRISAAADYSPHFMCKVCGHPYDHNGTPHSAYEAERVRAGKRPIRDGETLTGPDGMTYRWNGYLWIKLP